MIVAIVGAGVNLAERVRELRERLVPRVTQRELSKRIGANESYISGLEASRVVIPSGDLLRALARELGTTTVDLLWAAGYLSARDLETVEELLGDPQYSLALRSATAISNETLRKMVMDVIRRAHELEGR